MTFDEQIWLLIIGAAIGFGFATIGAFIQHGLESRRYGRENKDQREMLEKQFQHQQEMYERQLADQRTLFKEQMELERELRQKDERIKALTNYENPAAIMTRYTELRHELRMERVEYRERRLQVLRSLVEMFGDSAPDSLISMVVDAPMEMLDSLEATIEDVSRNPDKKDELREIFQLASGKKSTEEAKGLLEEALEAFNIDTSDPLLTRPQQPEGTSESDEVENTG